jgi:UDP-glucose 4-epimerase
MNLLQLMDRYDVRKLVFSSSATVYDASIEIAPFHESMRTGHTTNPYGTTKHVIEQLLQDMANWKDMSITSLRYFNPIGAHAS